jgi:hypothetical protein
MDDRKLRAAQIIRELITSLESFLEHAYRKDKLYPINFTDIEPLANYLRESGYKPDAERLEKDRRDLVKNVTDIWFSEIAKGESPEEQFARTERYGAYPAPTDDNEVMQDRRLVALGQASNMVCWLEGLRTSLQDGMNEIKPEVAGHTSSELANIEAQDTRTNDIEAAAIKPNAQSKPLLKRPPDKAFQAWQIRELLNISDQSEIAKKMDENGVKATQGQVSRWLKAVDEWRKAGGEIPQVGTLGESNLRHFLRENRGIRLQALQNPMQLLLLAFKTVHFLWIRSWKNY